jgi:PilZ domain
MLDRESMLLDRGSTGNRFERTEADLGMLRQYRDPRAPACRAPRYSIELPIRYRTPNAPAWHDGRTENISRSGVLIRTQEPLPPRTPIEILIALPTEVGGGDAPVICRGRVVRTEPPRAGGDGPQAMAATIVAIGDVHPQDADPRRI